MSTFDTEQLHTLLHELSNHLEAINHHAQLFIVGGAAMALAYDPGRLTRDVDAIFAPAPILRDLAARIATNHGLEPDWLNDAAKGFLPGPDDAPCTVFESDWLLVQVPSPTYLLAMKLYAARDERDLDDAATLYTLVGYTSPDQARDLLARTYPLSLLLPRHRYIVDDVAARATHRRRRRPRGLTL